jgi:hypothetical protein
MTEKYAVNERKPSKMFLRSLEGVGSSSIYCNCGRMHYAPNNLSNSDVDCALAEQKKNPDGIVINIEDDFITCKELDGKTFVEDCPCNGLRKYEDWIWGNRDVIREYYQFRVKQEAEWAEQEVLKNKLAGISK